MDFKHGDLVIKCHQCGGTEVIEEFVTDGRAIYLFNRSDSFLKLHCTKCDVTMEMCLVPTAVEEDEDAAVIVEETNETIKINEELPRETVPEETV